MDKEILMYSGDAPPETEAKEVSGSGGLRYVACWTEKDGLYYCACEHETIREAMGCMTPDGRTFIRAIENGELRSLTDEELDVFLNALTERFFHQGR